MPARCWERSDARSKANACRQRSQRPGAGQAAYWITPIHRWNGLAAGPANNRGAHAGAQGIASRPPEDRAIYDLKQIQVFVSVVEQRGIRAAAERLGLAQSSVSRAVSAAETRLGVRLIERSTRAFRITEVGRLYYDQCRAALDRIAQADVLVQSRSNELAGTLRVSVPVLLGTYLMSAVVPVFLSRHPKARVLLDASDRIVDLVPEGVDLVVRLGSPAGSSGLVTRLLARPAAGLYASAAYLGERGVPRAPDDLNGHRLLTLGTAEVPSHWTLRRGAEQVQVRPVPVMHTNDMPTLLAATAQGCGICMAPHFVCQRERLRETLVQVLPEWETDAIEVRTLYPSRRSVTPLLRTFVDLLAETAAQALTVEPPRNT